MQDAGLNMDCSKSVSICNRPVQSLAYPKPKFVFRVHIWPEFCQVSVRLLKDLLKEKKDFFFFLSNQMLTCDTSDLTPQLCLLHEIQ